MPADVNAREYVAPPDFVPLFQKPWSEVLVWGVASWKVQVTLSPRPTLTEAG